LLSQISSLHSTIASISFFASSGFYLSTAVLTSASTLSVQGLSTLNAVLGSTESSRAVAAIIELIKDEFKKPEVGKESEFVGYLDLFSGTVGFVLLQRWGRRKTEREFRESCGEEVIWDAVIDDKGFRADVVGTKRTAYYNGVDPHGEELLRRGRPVSFISPAGDEAIEAVERETIHESPNVSLSPTDQTRLTDEEIREHIMSQLPNGCHAVIASETITAKTIRVDLYNTGITEVTPPPGTVMVREHFHHTENHTPASEEHIPSQTIVFRTALRRTNSTDIGPTDKLKLTSSNHTHPETPYDSDDAIVMRGNIPLRHLQPQPSGSSTDRGISSANSGSESGEELDHTSMQPSRLTSSTMIPIANQKRMRRPIPLSASGSETAKPVVAKSTKSGSNKTADSTSNGKQKKDGPLRKALKSLSPSTSSIRMQEDECTPTFDQAQSPNNTVRSSIKTAYTSQIPRLTSPSQSLREKSLPRLPVSQTNPNTYGRKSPSTKGLRSAASQTFYTVREKRHDSMVHETETYSTHSFESRPGSPAVARTHSRTISGLSKARSDRDLSVWDADEAISTDSAALHHRRSRSFIPSLYSMASNGSETSLILASKGAVPRPSIFDDHDVLSSLAAQGKVPGIFPNDHLVRNVRRYARFSSASYGSQFLRFMGLTAAGATVDVSAHLQDEDIHYEHSSFSKHTGLPPDTILLSSFEDPHGGIGYSGSAASALPLVHFISIDRESKAVVLTCRGTLGFEDVLTDMLCDFDDLYWRGKTHKVHKGIHASARRMLGGKDSRVMATLKAALEEYPDFGLILTGHSLGGAVASLLAILVSEPSTVEDTGALFATTTPQKLLAHPDLADDSMLPPVTLPGGRPIHVYAYGPPATLSPSLRIATRGLITTIVNSNDIVPSLSLGMLHDFRTVALNLKHDTTGAIAALKSRVWERVRHAAQSAFYVDSGVPPPPENTAGDGLGEDTWAWAALKTLRAGMTSEKLVPPGEVFVVETTRVFDRQEGSPTTASAAVASDSATERVYKSLGRPATRVQMKLVRDVEGRFGELRFGSRMFSDHSPARYEATLAALGTGILEN
jgi:Lipase (class 3)